MKVYKFGGASVNSAERVANVAGILERCSEPELVIVISAMGKTTNALEKVAQAFFENKQDAALQLFEEIKNNISLLPSIFWLPTTWPAKPG